MIEEITLDQFTDRAVSIKRQYYIEQDGIKYAVGKPRRSAYKNTPRGRAELAEQLTGTDLEAVMLRWGSEPLESDEFDDEQYGG